MTDGPIDISRKLFHVRPVTQGDVIRADVKEIPRIFQVSFTVMFRKHESNSSLCIYAVIVCRGRGESKAQ